MTIGISQWPLFAAAGACVCVLAHTHLSQKNESSRVRARMSVMATWTIAILMWPLLWYHVIDEKYRTLETLPWSKRCLRKAFFFNHLWRVQFERRSEIAYRCSFSVVQRYIIGKSVSLPFLRLGTCTHIICELRSVRSFLSVPSLTAATTALNPSLVDNISMYKFSNDWSWSRVGGETLLTM